jgi:hypothetical protein
MGCFTCSKSQSLRLPTRFPRRGRHGQQLLSAPPPEPSKRGGADDVTQVAEADDEGADVVFGDPAPTTRQRLPGTASLRRAQRLTSAARYR